MDEDEIEGALKKRVADNIADPLVLPNISSDPARPHVRLTFARGPRSNRALAGGTANVVAVGAMLATVVVKKNTGTGEAHAKAEAIVALFPMGQRIALAAHRIVVTEPPSLLESYEDRADWLVPVRVRYLVEPT